MISQELGIKEYRGYPIEPITVNFPVDQPTEYYHDNPDLEVELRRIGNELIDQGLDQLVQEFYEGKIDMDQVIHELNVLAYPKSGNIIIERNDLGINYGEFRRVEVALVNRDSDGDSIDQNAVPVALPHFKDLDELVSKLNDVIVGLSYQVKNERDLNLLATFAKVALVRIHPFEEGNGRTSRAFFRFIRKFLSYQNGIQIEDEKWLEHNQEKLEITTLPVEEGKVFKELDLLEQNSERYKEMDINRTYLLIVGNEIMRDFLVRDGKSVIDILYDDIRDGLMKGIKKFIRLDDLRKSETLVKISNPRYRSRFISSQRV